MDSMTWQRNEDAASVARCQRPGVRSGGIAAATSRGVVFFGGLQVLDPTDEVHFLSRITSSSVATSSEETLTPWEWHQPEMYALPCFHGLSQINTKH